MTIVWPEIRHVDGWTMRKKGNKQVQEDECREHMNNGQIRKFCWRVSITSVWSSSLRSRSPFSLLSSSLQTLTPTPPELSFLPAWLPTPLARFFTPMLVLSLHPNMRHLWLLHKSLRRLKPFNIVLGIACSWYVIVQALPPYFGVATPPLEKAVTWRSNLSLDGVKWALIMCLRYSFHWNLGSNFGGCWMNNEAKSPRWCHIDPSQTVGASSGYSSAVEYVVYMNKRLAFWMLLWTKWCLVVWKSNRAIHWLTRFHLPCWATLSLRPEHIHFRCYTLACIMWLTFRPWVTGT